MMSPGGFSLQQIKSTVTLHCPPVNTNPPVSHQRSRADYRLTLTSAPSRLTVCLWVFFTQARLCCLHLLLRWSTVGLKSNPLENFACIFKRFGFHLRCQKRQLTLSYHQIFPQVVIHIGQIIYFKVKISYTFALRLILHMQRCQI